MVMYRLKLLKLMLHHAENTAICVEQQCADALTIAAAIQKWMAAIHFLRLLAAIQKMDALRVWGRNCNDNQR